MPLLRRVESKEFPEADLDGPPPLGAHFAAPASGVFAVKGEDQVAANNGRAVESVLPVETHLKAPGLLARPPSGKSIYLPI